MTNFEGQDPTERQLLTFSAGARGPLPDRPPGTPRSLWAIEAARVRVTASATGAMKERSSIKESMDELGDRYIINKTAP